MSPVSGRSSDLPSLRWLAAIWVVCFSLGLGYLALDPPYQSPDEPFQFLRAWTVSNGEMVAQIGGVDGHQPGGFVPDRLIESENLVTGDVRGNRTRRQDRAALAKAWEIPLEPERVHFARLPNTGGYSPLSYTGAALALRLLRCFDLPPLALFYGARLGNLFVWSLLVSAALWLVPTGRWLLGLLALTPMALFQAASCSADGWNHGLALLTLAWFVRLALQPGPLSRGEIGLALLLLFLAGLTRQIFVPLALLALMVPRSRFDGSGRRLAFLLGSGLAAALPAALWTHLTRFHLVPLRAEAIPEHQIQFALSNPLVVLQKIAATLPHGCHWLTEFIGALGWLDTPLPPGLIASFWGALVVALLLGPPGSPTPSLVQRLPPITAFAGSFVLVMYGLFVVWTPQAGALIEGMQGRYLTPLAPLLALALAGPLLRLPERALAVLSMGVALGLNAWALSALYARFWSPT